MQLPPDAEPIPGRYFIGVWLNTYGAFGDALTCVFRDADAPWQLRARIRYFEDPAMEQRKDGPLAGDPSEDEAERMVDEVVRDHARMIETVLGIVHPVRADLVYIPLHTADAATVLARLAAPVAQGASV